MLLVRWEGPGGAYLILKGVCPDAICREAGEELWALVIFPLHRLQGVTAVKATGRRELRQGGAAVTRSPQPHAASFVSESQHQTIMNKKGVKKHQ